MRKRLISILAVLSLLAALCTGAAFAADETENASNYEIGDIEIGNIVTYGGYEQDGFYSNGEETIEWIVIARDRDNHALLLSRYCLDALPYNEDGGDVTWEDSSIRAWLNGEFLESAFGGDPNGFICTAECKTKDGRSGTDGGENTTDRIFLLAVDEVTQYFPKESSRRAPVTEYAKEQGAEYDKNGNGWWWLRTPGKTQDMAAGVHTAGGVNYDGRDVDRTDLCIRPALWLDLDVVTAYFSDSTQDGDEAAADDETGAEKTADNGGTKKTVDADKLMHSGYTAFGHLEDGTIYVCGRSDEEGTVDGFAGNVIYLIGDVFEQSFEARWNANKNNDQKLEWTDIDGDGEDELVLIADIASGTGVNMEELSVFEPQPDGSFEHHYLSFEKMEELLNEYLTAKVRGENITLTLTENGSRTGENCTESAGPGIDMFSRYTLEDGKYSVELTALLHKEGGEYVYANPYLALSDDAYDPDTGTDGDDYITVALGIYADVVYDGEDFALENLRFIRFIK